MPIKKNGTKLVTLVQVIRFVSHIVFPSGFPAFAAACILMLSLPFSPVRAQISSDSLFDKVFLSIEDLPDGLTDIEVDQEGNLFLLQPDKHRLHKLFKVGRYDSTLTIGGKGIGDEGFNFPTKISVANRQNVFLLDQMNRRLVLLNTNLRLIQDINFLTLQISTAEDAENFWPVSFSAGPSGELFFLNQEDLKIYKFNTNGIVERSFGGLDYGNGSLIDPHDIVMSTANLLFAVDSTEQKVSIFDLYGTYQYALQIPMKFRWKNLAVYDGNLFFLGTRHIFIYNLFSKNGSTITLKPEQVLQDAVVSRDFIYLLFENQVNLYRITN